MGATGTEGYMSKLSDLYSFLVIEVPGCPQPVMLQALQMGTRRFCEKTESWIEWLDHHNIVDGKVEYILDWNYCAEIRRIKEVRINSAEGVTAGDPGQVIDPEYYEFNQTETLELDDSLEPEADIANALDVKVVFVPLLNTCELPQWFLNRYSNAIIAWALKHLLSMSRKKWTDPQRASYWMDQYNKEVTRSMFEVEKKNKDIDLQLSA